MSPSNQRRRVFKYRNIDTLRKNSADWLQLILGEINQYNDWVTKRNEKLEMDDDPSTVFYHPPLRSVYDKD
tara:strand:+ start:543 stop:755 length:213 start_codon:yes stop_codon:yes gene_type:complete